jgi:PrtD family type I secretion system ABC transporter
VHLDTAGVSPRQGLAGFSVTRTTPPSEPDLDATLSDQAARLEKVIAEMRAARPRPRAGELPADQTGEAPQASGMSQVLPSPTAETAAAETLTAVEPAATVTVAPPKANSKKVRPSTVVASAAPEAPLHAAHAQQASIATAPRGYTAEEADPRATNTPPLRETNRVGEASTIALKKPAGERHGELWEALTASHRSFWAVCRTSIAINMLMLTGPLFMLQVYDRVLSSGSFPTLISLSIITAALYLIIGMLEFARSRIIGRVGAEIDQRLSDRVFEAALRRSLATQGAGGSALRELDSFRQFISGPAPITFFDAPWTPVYLGVIFMTHWLLGIAAVAGTFILLFLAWISEQRGRMPLAYASKAVTQSIEMAETGQRNAEAITAMGMLGAYRARWQMLNGEGLGWQLLAADRLGGMSAVTKTMRLLLQSLMLAIAAGLAIEGAISAGSIIAATIIFGRALAPVEQVIGHWRGFIKARESYFKLEEVLSYAPPEKSRTELPRPKGVLDVQNIRVAAPETRNVILTGITFNAQPGQMLAVIGPSASGKSTLVRALVGLWPTFGGAIMLDGARLDQWHPEDLGQYIGYLPQSVELFAGTVKQNISRFRDDATDDQIVEAAKQAHAHELILALPKGYDTELGAYATYLSGGQRQRLALARAMFGTPPLVVLDEPNSNLDRPGDEALSSAIDGMRARGQTIILVSHRVQAIGKADLLLFLEKGQQRAFGPRNEVMKMFQGPTPARRANDELRERPTAAPQPATVPDAAPAAPEAAAAERPTGSDG